MENHLGNVANYRATICRTPVSTLNLCENNSLPTIYVLLGRLVGDTQSEIVCFWILTEAANASRKQGCLALCEGGHRA